MLGGVALCLRLCRFFPCRLCRIPPKYWKLTLDALLALWMKKKFFFFDWTTVETWDCSCSPNIEFFTQPAECSVRGDVSVMEPLGHVTCSVVVIMICNLVKFIRNSIQEYRTGRSSKSNWNNWDDISTGQACRFKRKSYDTRYLRGFKSQSFMESLTLGVLRLSQLCSWGSGIWRRVSR